MHVRWLWSAHVGSAVALAFVMAIFSGCSGSTDDDDTESSSALIELSSDTLDFGDVLLWEEESREVTISNTGNDSLTITGYGWDEIRSTWTLQADTTTIEPNGTYTFSITWKPETQGESQAILTVSSDASNAPSASITCTGKGVSPDDDNDGYSIADGDCDDDNPSVNPGEEETCDGVDDNCDGEPDNVPSSLSNSWYEDGDHDGYGQPSERPEKGCDPPDARGWSDNDLDCDDSNPDINPDATEVCDDIDNNCDGTKDEGFDANYDGVADCFDFDEDGFTGDEGDCDDTDAGVNPLATEIPDNGKDDNCDGNQNENAPPDLTAVFPTEIDNILMPGVNQLVVKVFDYNDPYEDLRVDFSFASEGEEPGTLLCGDVVPDADGYAYCEMSFEYGRYQLDVTASDTVGETSSVSLPIVVDNAPTISVVQPEDGAEVLYAEYTAFTVEVLDADDEDTIQTLTLTWSSSLEGDLVVRELPASSPDTVTAGVMLQMEGEQVVTATVADSLGVTASASVQVVVLPPDCGSADVVAIWHMDEGSGITTTDSVAGIVGNLNGTTWVSSSTSLATAFNNAISFDDETSQMEVVDEGNLLSLQEFTIDFWYKPAGRAAGQPVTRQALVYKNGASDTGDKANYYVNINTDGFLEAQLAWGGSATLKTRNAVIPILTGSWYHFAATFDGQHLRTYVNGVQDGAADAGIGGWVPYMSAETSMWLGTSTDDPNATRPWTLVGAIDDLRIMSCAVGSGQILQYYDTRKPHEVPEIETTPTPAPEVTPTPSSTETPGAVTPTPSSEVTPTPVAASTPAVTPTPGVTPTPASN